MRFKFLLPIGAILFIYVNPLTAQRLKSDTAYYSGSGELVNKTSDYLTFVVSALDKKKRIHGVVEKFTKTGRLLEATEYLKGVKTGSYERFHRNGKIMIYGIHKNGNRVSFWATLDQEGGIQSIEEYDEKGNLILTRNRPHLIERKAQPSSDAETDTEEVYIVLEEPAKFPGGMERWNQHLEQNLKYPLEAKRHGYKGDVLMTFVVLADGRIAIPRIVESPNSILSKEAIRMLQISPKWNPATLQGKPVDSEMKLRIVFRLR